MEHGKQSRLAGILSHDSLDSQDQLQFVSVSSNDHGITLNGFLFVV